VFVLMVFVIGLKIVLHALQIAEHVPGAEMVSVTEVKPAVRVHLIVDLAVLPAAVRVGAVGNVVEHRMDVLYVTQEPVCSLQ